LLQFYAVQHPAEVAILMSDRQTGPDLQTPSVIVAGAGPTGLTMAAELIRHGVECRIVDAAPKPTDQSRALVVHARTLEAFDNMGIADEAIARGIKSPAANIIADGRLLLRISLAEIGSRYRFALMIPQSETERIINGHLEALGGTVERSVELTGATQDNGGVVATLKHADGRIEQARCDWLIGCDGAHSVVRHALGMAFEGVEYQTIFSLADVHVDWSNAPDELFIYLADNGLVAFFPIGGGRYRVVAETPIANTNPPTLGEFQTFVDGCAPAGTRLHDPVWLERFRIHRRRVPNYRSGRIFLAGDAAHIHSPAGGQGMNTGIQDAYNLAWKLALVVAGGAPESILDSYQDERHAVSTMVLRNTDRMTKVGTIRGALGKTIRDYLIPLLGAIPPLAHALSNQMAGLTIEYSASSIVNADHLGLIGRVAAMLSASGPAAGSHAPDCEPIIDSSGKSTWLAAAVRGTSHSLLIFEGMVTAVQTSRMTEIAAAMSRRAGSRIRSFIIIANREGLSTAPDYNAEIIGDPALVAHRAYGAADPCLYLIRPDGYIGFRGSIDNSSGLIEYLGRIFT